MRIRIVTTVEFDAADWAQEYVVHPDEVRADARAHFVRQIEEAVDAHVEFGAVIR